MGKLDDLHEILSAKNNAENVLLMRNLPKNNPAARDFRAALERLFKALDKF